MNSKPQTQAQEALLELIRKGTTDRRELMNKFWIMNAPEVIRQLRQTGVSITTVKKIKLNKFGREISYGEYRLDDREEALKTYKKLTT